MNGTINPTLPTKGDPLGTSDAKIRGSLITLREDVNELLNSENKLLKSKLETGATPVTWYPPKVIAAEETRTNTAFGTLTTADEITGVVLPENGLIVIGYLAAVKQSAAVEATRIALFLNGKQLKNNGEAQETTIGTESNFFTSVSTVPKGLDREVGALARATTGEVLASGQRGGFCAVFAAAGTYAISVQYKAFSGSVTAKERKLWVETHGY